MLSGRILTCVALLTAAICLQPARAGEWGTDYEAAYKQAKEKGRPLIVDFGTANCFWCKKMHETTFRDPTVVRRLAEGFVAVQVDAERESRLAQALGVTRYPTLVFAAPDGTILGMHVGYVDAEKFQQQLDRVWRESGLQRPTVIRAQNP